MKKALKSSKLSSPSKFVRKVLSRTSNASKQSGTDKSEEIMKDTLPLNVELEISALKEQVNMLQLTISEMQQESDMKEKSLANIAREKEQLTYDLRKQKRSNTNLKQQLEDEREFYYKEKKQYCQEMNDVKKLKTNLKKSDYALLEQEISSYIKEIKQLKQALNQTLEANYNLSIKFLRMKNTKTDLKNRLKNLQDEHDRAMTDLKAKIEYIKSEIRTIVENQYKLPISPSSKKYLKIVRHNGNLIHENLCLQLQVDQLHEKMHKIQSKQNRKETKEKLRYINSKTKIIAPENSLPKTRSTEKITKTTKDSHKISVADDRAENEAVVTKVFEKNPTPDVPIIITQPTDDATTKKVEPSSMQATIKTSSSRLTLCQVSTNTSCISTGANDFASYATSYTAVRTQSAPEIVQSSLFSNDKSIRNSVTCLINN